MSKNIKLDFDTNNVDMLSAIELAQWRAHIERIRHKLIKYYIKSEGVCECQNLVKDAKNM